MEIEKQWVLITGASSGLGWEIAFQLATQGKYNLIITARREENLKKLLAKIKQDSKIEVDIVVADLSVPDDSDRLIDFCLAKPNFHGAILNAGSTYVGSHSAISDEKMAQIIQLNILTTSRQLTQLVRHFENNQSEGKIMVVSSLAANFALPYQALYSGSKAFLTNFTTALRKELTNPRLSLSTLSPGGIKTELSQIEELKSLDKHNMPVEAGAREAIKCFENGKYNYTPGRANRIGIGIASVILPKRFISSILGRKFAGSIAESRKKL